MSTQLPPVPLLNLQHVAEGISVRFGMTVTNVDVLPSGEVRIGTVVPDKDYGHVVHVEHWNRIDTRMGMSVGEQLRDILMRVMQHEIDESLRVNGVLLHDPHS